MSEFINENPNVVDASQLPTRTINDIEEYENSGYSQDISASLASCQQWRELKNIITDSDSSVFNALTTASTLLNLQQKLSHNNAGNDSLKVSTNNAEKEELLDSQEIYDLIAHISDPEHPLTLGELSVVNLPDIEVINKSDETTTMGEIVVHITPTITHCSLATLIGLGIRVRLERSLSPKYRLTILLKKGSHQSENQVNKQLNDKERVAAACENEQLLGVISKMLGTCK